jgi:hypothetical protein
MASTNPQGTLRWKKIKAGIYHATSPWGLYTIDGNKYAHRKRWMVTYPDDYWALFGTLAEAKLWAENDAETRARRTTASSHSTNKCPIVGCP